MSGHDDTTNDAFDQAVLSHIGLIRHIGASRLRRREIEDFTQSVLLKIYANRDQLRMHGLKSWIGTVARNTATAWNRKREPIFTDALPDIPFPVPPVDEMLEGQERWQSLVECLRSLSREDEALLRAFYIEERSYEELQGQLSLPYRALSVRLSRARKRLREHASGLLACLGFATSRPGERAFGETTLGGNRMAMTTSAALSAFLVAFAGIGLYHAEQATITGASSGSQGGLSIPVHLATGKSTPSVKPIANGTYAAPERTLAAPSLGTWSQLPDMPESRCCGAAITVGEGVYLIAGEHPFDMFTDVRMFDSRTGVWTEKAPIPGPRGYMDAVALHGKIYVIGGNAGRTFAEPFIAEYDPTADSWRERKTAIEPGYYGAAATNGRIYLIPEMGKGRPTLEYDPITGIVRKRAPMPTERGMFATVASVGRIYVVGGMSAAGGGDLLERPAVFYDTVEEYDPLADVWTARASMPAPRVGRMAISIGSRIYVVGEELPKLGLTASIYEYDVRIDTWTEGAAPPSSVDFASASAVDGVVHVFGGYSFDAGPAAPGRPWRSTLQTYDTGLDNLPVGPHGKLSTTWGNLKFH
jgi:RNA polymerase sigma factor (sigma-70 family)